MSWFFFFSSRRRHTRYWRDWSSDVCSSDLLELDALGGYLLGHGVGHDLDALVDHPGAGGPSQGRVELGQDVREGFDEDYPYAVRVDVRIVRCEVLVHEGVDLRSRLDPRRPAADDHEGELGLRDLSPYQGDLLETFYDPVADALGVLDASHLEAVLLDPRDAEEVGQPAQRDHDVIVGELNLPVRRHDLPLEVKPLGLRPAEAGPGQNEGPSQRLGDVAGVYVAAHYARHHGPEGEEVVLGYYKDPDIFAVLAELTQIFGGRVPSEAPAQDEHLFVEVPVRGLLPGSVAGGRIQGPPHRSEPDGQPA